MMTELTEVVDQIGENAETTLEDYFAAVQALSPWDDKLRAMDAIHIALRWVRDAREAVAKQKPMPDEVPTERILEACRAQRRVIDTATMKVG